MVNIPAKRLKKQFKAGIDQYLKKMGRTISVHLPPYTVYCPNCIFDAVRKASSNVYDTKFVRPVNIFPGTVAERKIYPAPFNIEVAPSGVQYNPDLVSPKILKTTVCPVCNGDGRLVEDYSMDITALVTWNPKENYLDLAPGLEGESVCRIKTFETNYALCREAKYFTIDGVKCEHHSEGGVPRLKGLGADHLTEFYLIAVEKDKSVSDKFDEDARLQYNNIGRVSDQASSSTPTIPPAIPGDDVW